ncbi:MAG: hypothetical protein U9Q27_02640 [Patescibacteria group bacterium]|nr:hypothetical protein [Patescibacteria group bacterium]
MENPEELISEDSEIMAEAMETLKEDIAEARKIKKHPEICHITDQKRGLSLELHSTKTSIEQLTKQALSTLHVMASRKKNKTLSMIS